MIKIGKYYYSMEHRGGLKESLKTIHPMHAQLADILIESGYYRYYSKDKRLKAERYIIDHMEWNLGFPQWILIADEAITR